MSRILFVIVTFIVIILCVGWGGSKLVDCHISKLGIKSPSVETTCNF